MSVFSRSVYYYNIPCAELGLAYLWIQTNQNWKTSHEQTVLFQTAVHTDLGQEKQAYAPPLCHLSYVPITGSLRQRGREALGRRLNTRQKIPALWNAVSKLTQYEDFRYVTRVRMTSSDPDSLSLSLQFFFTLPDSMAACGKAAREWAFGHCLVSFCPDATKNQYSAFKISCLWGE